MTPDLKPIDVTKYTVTESGNVIKSKTMTEVDKAFLKYYGLDDSEIEHAEEEWDFREEDNYDLFKAGADCRQAEIDELKEQVEKSRTEKCTTCRYNTVGQDEYIRGLEEQQTELQEEINEWKTKFENLQKYLNTQNCYRECAETWQKNKELKEQIMKMKWCINDLVHLGEFNENTDEEYLNYQVHEALKNTEQFIKDSEGERRISND